MKRTTCTIHLDNLKHNVEIIKGLTKGSEIIAIIKADAYGHGAAKIYPALKECGIENFAIATLSEGIELREAGLKDPVIVLVDTQDDDLKKLVDYNLTQAVFSLDTAEKINEYAKEKGVKQPVALKLDTGMSRVGFQVYGDYLEKSIEDIKALSELSNIEITSAFTHFANADDLEDGFSDIQFERFKTGVEKIREAGVTIPKLHVSNTPSILLHPEYQLDMVRPGDILYGLLDLKQWEKYNFKEVMTWETYIDLVKEIPEGATVGYGRTYKAEGVRRIASLPLGFADGYSRALSNKGYVVIHGKIAPIVGRVCMDQFMVDVTDIPEAKRGDEVKLLDGDMISIYKMAELIGRDVDEIVLGVSKRVPKVYVK
ncbi:MAG: alanine racemase [Clostridia bacterium]|nr:alanine racemase [Clostridia bacterium]